MYRYPFYRVSESAGSFARVERDRTEDHFIVSLLVGRTSIQPFAHRRHLARSEANMLRMVASTGTLLGEGRLS